MKKLLMIFILITTTSLYGCETMDSTYYTNPTSPGYHEQALGGTCEVCGRAFVISGYQLDHVENITCPFDGHPQNTKFAYNRYVYASQQQQQANDRAFFENLERIRKENQD